VQEQDGQTKNVGCGLTFHGDQILLVVPSGQDVLLRTFSGKQEIFTGADKGVERGQVQYFQRSMSLEDAMKGHIIIC
jgi:hypothetical protein